MNANAQRVESVRKSIVQESTEVLVTSLELLVKGGDTSTHGRMVRTWMTETLESRHPDAADNVADDFDGSWPPGVELPESVYVPALLKAIAKERAAVD